MTNLTGSRVLRRAPGVRWREFGSDGILLDPASGEYLQINDIGVLIWKSLDAPATIDDVIGRVCAQFDGNTGEAANDIHEFVVALTRRRFLEVDAS